MSGAPSFCVTSMSARSADGADAAYIAWHALDHLPEQYGIPGMVHGQRWVSTPSCRAARVGSDERFAATDHVVQYLFTDPIDPALQRFFALGAELNAAGRMPIRLPPVELGGYAFVGCVAEVVDPAVVPWRPCRGVFLMVEREPTPPDALLAVDGVAGVWTWRGGRFHERLADTTGLTLTVTYLDGEPADVAAGLATQVAGTPLFAAPLMALVPFAWDRHLP